MKILANRIEITAFHGKYPIITNIIIDENSIERAAHFEYQGCDVTYEMDQLMLRH
jgi:hypothetical protein